ncbi:hypothetical protein IE368CO2PC_02629 [Enterococcus faecalis]|uniref:hypothetical protein n=1 Tax=Enterococcus faecalis TaxID=1351 RepID=UPI000669519E|nr:hypothetical protein [Enterococcus faecalis]MDU5019750.1 hypothetical protein [Clostridiales bacterium]EHF1090205.1 hypothetical protein [Enterococcus faecalis]EKN1390283.1 hypothetical protein [Enterococcus faecalis]MBT9729150.1 hypothetical protein [Enterococcus faecalis]CAC9755558.1 hypothetical protein IE368CO2PC_02629 [Enterococcus faecalis]
MKLTEIVEEIAIGYMQNDPKSKKLAKHVDEVKEILNRKGVISKGRSFNFQNFPQDDLRSESKYILNQGSVIFYQGSYAIHTAIMFGDYFVDADVAFYIDEFIDLGIRERIFEALKYSFDGKYVVELKKPCITIDFGDQYMVDIAIYSKSSDGKSMRYHNCIGGTETTTAAVPKRIVSEFSNYLSNNELKRPVVRLMKYFTKNASNYLRIEDNDKIPSISFILLAYLEYRPTDIKYNEDSVKRELIAFAKCFKEYVVSHKELKEEHLMITNTFYKVSNFDKVLQVINEVLQQVQSENYASLMTSNHVEAVEKRRENSESSRNTAPLMGTMG